MSAEVFAAARGAWRDGPPPASLTERRTVDEPPRLALCPRCGRLMDRRDVGGAFGATIDLCRGHGLWLDAGELEKLRVVAETSEGATVAAELSAAPRTRPIPFGDDRWWVEPRPEGGPEQGLLVALVATVASWLIPR